MYASIYPVNCWYFALRVETYVCTHTYMYVYVCVFIHIYMQRAVDILCCALRYMCIYSRAYVYAYIYVLYTHTYLYAYTYVCICNIYTWRENERAMPQGLGANCRKSKWNSFITRSKLKNFFYISARFVLRKTDGSRRAERSYTYFLHIFLHISLSAQLDEKHSNIC